MDEETPTDNIDHENTENGGGSGLTPDVVNLSFEANSLFQGNRTTNFFEMNITPKNSMNNTPSMNNNDIDKTPTNNELITPSVNTNLNNLVDPTGRADYGIVEVNSLTQILLNHSPFRFENKNENASKPESTKLDQVHLGNLRKNDFWFSSSKKSSINTTSIGPLKTFKHPTGPVPRKNHETNRPNDHNRSDLLLSRLSDLKQEQQFEQKNDPLPIRTIEITNTHQTMKRNSRQSSTSTTGYDDESYGQTKQRRESATSSSLPGDFQQRHHSEDQSISMENISRNIQQECNSNLVSYVSDPNRHRHSSFSFGFNSSTAMRSCPPMNHPICVRCNTPHADNQCSMDSNFTSSDLLFYVAPPIQQTIPQPKLADENYPFKCKLLKENGIECGQKFKRSDELARHKQTLGHQETSRKNICPWSKSDVNCPYSTSRKDNYDAHIRTHTNHKPFTCPYEEWKIKDGDVEKSWVPCGYAANRQDDWAKHELKMHLMLEVADGSGKKSGLNVKKVSKTSEGIKTDSYQSRQSG